MDFHVFTSNAQNNDSGKQSKTVKNFFLNFLPIFVLAALLPAFLFLVNNPPNISFTSKATANELRIWLEPKTVTASVGKDVELTVMAQFENETKLIPSVAMKLSSGERVALDKNEISYKTPFSGRVTIGTVKATASAAGTYQISIDPTNVSVVAFAEELKVFTSGATIMARK